MEGLLSLTLTTVHIGLFSSKLFCFVGHDDGNIYGTCRLKPSEELRIYRYKVHSIIDTQCIYIYAQTVAALRVVVVCQ